MTCKSLLLTAIAVTALSGAGFAAALADDYYESRGRLLHDDQAEQTRELNRQALEQAHAQDRSQSQSHSRPMDNDSDNEAAVVPTDDRDQQDKADDEDNGRVRDKHGPVRH